MLLEIRHVTQYHYDRPGARKRHGAVDAAAEARPTSGWSASSWRSTRRAQLFSYADSFGNAVYHFDVPQPHERLTIIARSAVETQRAARPARRARPRRVGPAASRLRARRVLRLPAPARLRRSRPRRWRAFVADKGLDDLRAPRPADRAARALNAVDLRGLRLRGRRHRGRQPDRPRARRRRKGVCQDFAHVMIAICRELGRAGALRLGLPVHRPQAHGDRSDPDATHAWVEVFLPSAALGGPRSDQQHPGRRAPRGRGHRPRLRRRAALARGLQGRGGEPAGGRRLGAPGPRGGQPSRSSCACRSPRRGQASGAASSAASPTTSSASNSSSRSACVQRVGRLRSAPLRQGLQRHANVGR